MLQAFQAEPHEAAESWAVPAPEYMERGMGTSWAHGSTHVATAFAPAKSSQGGHIQLLVARVANHAYK